MPSSEGSCTSTRRRHHTGDFELQIKDPTKIVDLLLGVFALWPSHTKSERLPAKERAKEKMKIITAGGHEWERLNDAWRSNLCLATARSKRTMLTKTAEKCKDDGSIGNGHKPFVVSCAGQADVVMCALCGKYVQEKKEEHHAPLRQRHQ